MKVSDFIGNMQEVTVELLVVAVLFFFFEKIRPSHKNMRFFKKDFFKELSLGLLNKIIFTPLFSIAMTLLVLANLKLYLPYQIFDEYITRLPLVAQVFAGAFLMDFSTYWRHRFMHKFLWRVHSVHHSAEEVNWMTALRLNPVELIFVVFCDMTFIYILGFSGPAIVFSAMFVWFYNYFAHANINVEYDWPLRYILASPNFHRWHHAADKKAYDKNFCGVFSCIDLLFGTYYNPKGPPEICGLVPEELKVPKK